MYRKNYLDYIPEKSPEITWENRAGQIVVQVKNKGFFNRIAQLLCGRPKISHIAFKSVKQTVKVNRSIVKRLVAETRG